jgi:hypothetical protein
LKKLIIALAIVIIVIIITSSTAFFINNIYDKGFRAEIVEDKDIIYPKNTWYIDFNKKIDEVTINDSSIYLIDSNDEKIETSISINKENNLLKLQPAEYLSGWKTYTLVVNEKVKSEDGESIKNNIKKKFNMNSINFKISTEKVDDVKNIENEEDLFFEIVNGLKETSEKIEVNMKDLDEDSYDFDSIYNYIKDYLPYLNLYIKEMSFDNDSDKAVINISYSSDVKDVKEKKKELLESSKKYSDKLKNIKSDFEKENLVYEYIMKTIKKPTDSRLKGEGFEFNNLETEEVYNNIEKYEYTTVENYLTLNYLNVFCIAVNGKTGGLNHSWNIAKIDKNYVHIDMPWSVYISSNFDNNRSYRFFNMNDDVFLKTHSWNDSIYPKCSKNLNIEDCYGKNLYEVENEDGLYDFFKKATTNNMDIVALKYKTEDIAKYNLNETLANVVEKEKEYINVNFSRFDENGIADGDYTYMELYLKQN